MIYAVYRMLYGEDFIQESIGSLLDTVDKVFVFWTDEPFAGVEGCHYKGQYITFPRQFDQVVDRVKQLQDGPDGEKIELVYNSYINLPTNQFTVLVNEHILPNYPKPDTIIFLETDLVWRADQLQRALAEFHQSGSLVASSRQIELWKTPKYRVPERPSRSGSILWDMRQIQQVPPTRMAAEGPGMTRLAAFVHNFGFCRSERNMYWKHLLSLGFSEKIGDSIPNESWYEEKWLAWDPRTNNRDMEISRGHEHMIPYAFPYDPEGLPSALRRNMLCGTN